MLIAAGLVYLALAMRPSGVGPVITETRLQLEGAALSELIAGPGTRAEFMPDAAGGPASRATAMSSMEASGRLSAGVGAVVPPEFEARVIGRRMRVEVEMRALDDSLTQAHIAYFTVGGGDSGWRLVEVGPDYAVASFIHSVPSDEPANGQEWIGVWPDADGRARSLLIRRITVTLLDEDDA